jgi:cell division protein FtsB
MFIALTISLLGSNGLLRLKHLRSERSALEQKDAELSTQLAEIRAEIEAVKGDQVAIERRVRTELGFARPDEVVYVFPKSPQ